MIVLITLNQKGGSGKTTTAVNAAAAFVAEGYRVLLLDNDPQGHVARSLGLEEVKGGGTSTLFSDSTSPIENVVQEARPGLNVVLADRQLSKAARAAGEADGLFRLADRSEEFMKLGDVVIVDCPPQLETLSLAALVLGADLVKRGARGGLLVPVAAEPLAVHGLADLTETVERLQRRELAPPIVAVVPTRVDLRTNVGHDVKALLNRQFDGKVTTPVRLSVRLSEAPDTGETIFEYDPKGRGAEDYRAVARDIIRIVNQANSHA